MGFIIFNGISSKDYHIQVEHPPGYDTPERDYEIVHVPGRNGDVIIDKGSYQNKDRSYEIAIGSEDRFFPEMANDISEWLHSAIGYARLEDSYEPEYYRMAVYKEETEIENILFHAGRVTVKFNCKPQRFLKSGDTKIKFSSSGILKNPTRHDALPIITVYGSGSGVLNIGGYIVSISEIGDSIVINSEIQDAYKDMENRNSDVTLSNGFPKLVRGTTNISFSGGITSVEVIPKWWTL